MRHIEMPVLMGIVNVTPDSFSDGGRYLQPKLAIEHALRMLEEGADIVDIGGESTRPPGRDYGVGSRAVEAAEELRRVIPVIEGVRRARPDAVISVDTMKPEVARRAVEAGARIINDVSGGRFDEEIFHVAAESGARYVLMHGHDPSDIRPVDQIGYRDVVEEVFEFLRTRIERARAAGVREVIADVGIGFSKGVGENVALLRRHERFLELGVPLLVGASRKSFVGRLTGLTAPQMRLNGTLAAEAVAVLNGATMLRVHDVAPTREFFAVLQALGD